jgi:hypothetical protein
MDFTCDCCKYTTKIKSNYSKHLFTDKHINAHTKLHATRSEKSTVKKVSNVSQKLAKVSIELAKSNSKYLCKYCEKEYNHKSSLSKHIKYSCTKNKDEDLKELVRLLNLQLQHKDKQLETQAKQIEKLMGKLEINGSFNNNTINNYTLLAYRDTDIAHLTQEDYRSCYKQVNHCVKHLIEKVHFNPSKPENMNIYISNMKDKYLMVYDGNNWNLANKTQELDRLYEEKEMMLDEWLESNPDPILKDKFVKYLNNKESDDCLNHIKEEIKLMLYNKGNQLIKKEPESVHVY